MERQAARSKATPFATSGASQLSPEQACPARPPCPKAKTNTQDNVMITDTMTGCSGLDSVYVTVTGGPLRISTEATYREICLGDSTTITAFAEGGTGEYTFEWSSDPQGFTSTEQSITIAPEDTTVYNLRVGDGNRSIVTAVQIIVHQPPLADAGEDAVVCPDADQVGICAEEVPGATYQWQSSEGVIDSGRCVSLTNGEWSLNVIDTNACSATDTLRIDESDLNVTLYPDSSVEISGGIAPYDTAFQQIGDTLVVFVTDAVGCEVSDRLIGTSISEPTIFQDVRVYPNPASETVMIKGLENRQFSVRLYDPLGKQVIFDNNPDPRITLSNLTPGNYYLRIVLDNGHNKTYPIHIIR